MTQPLPDLTERLRQAGFGLVGSMAGRWWNRTRPAEQQLRVGERSDPLVLVIGTTRTLWNPFRAACARSADLRREAHPLEQYTEQVITGLVSQVPVDSRIEWAHRRTDGPRDWEQAPPLDFIRLAQLAGLGWRAPSYLLVHPVYGPWVGLRAAVVLDLPAPSGAPPEPDICGSCAHGCRPVFEEVRAQEGYRWEDWLRVRRACPRGERFAYGPDQTRYHYTQDRDLIGPRD